MSSVRKVMRRRLQIRLRTVVLLAVALLAAAPLALAQAPPSNLVMHEAPEPVSAIAFADAQGEPRSLADFRGKVVLLNVWATWCVPCRKEIPALDRLGAILRGEDFAVVAVSVDRRGIDAVRRLFAELDVQSLPIYSDPSGQAMRTVRAVGLPISLVIDREGREVGRAIGPAAWDAGATVAFFRDVIARASRGDGRSDHAGASRAGN